MLVFSWSHVSVSFADCLLFDLGPHLDAEAVVCGCTMLLFACDDSENVVFFHVCE